MTIRKDLVKAIAKARGILGESAELVTEFLKSQINADGGFRGRSSDSDLYYTMFGIEALCALGGGIPRNRLVGYLHNFYSDSSLDIVHLCCLARCLADLCPEEIDDVLVEKITSGIDGHFGAAGSAYDLFLALGAYQDLGVSVPNTSGFVDHLASLKRSEGGYVNESGISAASVPSTAAALCVLHYLGGDVDEGTVDRLLKRFSPEGGFLAVENAPVADLLSTATAIHALNLVGADISNLQERCLDFVDTLWDGKGGFCGSVADRTCDCEYTFYGLLALGHLSEK